MSFLSGRRPEFILTTESRADCGDPTDVLRSNPFAQHCSGESLGNAGDNLSSTAVTQNYPSGGFRLGSRTTSFLCVWIVLKQQSKLKLLVH